MQTLFQLPTELVALSDDEFWQRVEQIDELSAQLETNTGAFAITMSTGDKQTTIPFIRFKPTFPSSKS